jgi:hypothetical protein
MMRMLWSDALITNDADLRRMWKLARAIRALLPAGMPEMTEDIEVLVWKKCDGVLIYFANQDLTWDAVEGRPIQVKIDYNGGYCMVGGPQAYTWRMIAEAFATPVPTWRILPLPGLMKDPRGAAIHEGAPDPWLAQFDWDTVIELPDRIQQHETRGPIINADKDETSAHNAGWVSLAQNAAMPHPNHIQSINSQSSRFHPSCLTEVESRRSRKFRFK